VSSAVTIGLFLLLLLLLLSLPSFSSPAHNTYYDRVLKSNIRRRLREHSERLKDLREVPYRKLVVTYLNLVLLLFFNLFFYLPFVFVWMCFAFVLFFFFFFFFFFYFVCFRFFLFFLLSTSCYLRLHLRTLLLLLAQRSFFYSRCLEIMIVVASTGRTHCESKWRKSLAWTVFGSRSAHERSPCVRLFSHPFRTVWTSPATLSSSIDSQVIWALCTLSS
jgi:hypothetical protein